MIKTEITGPESVEDEANPRVVLDPNNEQEVDFNPLEDLEEYEIPEIDMEDIELDPKSKYHYDLAEGPIY